MTEEEFRDVNANSEMSHEEFLYGLDKFLEERQQMTVIVKFVNEKEYYYPVIAPVYKGEFGFYSYIHGSEISEKEMIELGYKLQYLTIQEINDIKKTNTQLRKDRIITCRFCNTQVRFEDYKGGCGTCHEKSKGSKPAHRLVGKRPPIIVTKCEKHNYLIEKGASCPACEKELKNGSN